MIKHEYTTRALHRPAPRRQTVAEVVTPRHTIAEASGITPLGAQGGTPVALSLAPGEGLSPLPGTTEWPTWSLLLAVLVVAVAVLCALRLAHRAVCHILAILWRKTPRPVVWAVRAIPVPRWTRLRLLVGMVIVSAGCFLATRWVQARVWQQPPLTVPTHVVVPATHSDRTVPPKTFTLVMVPALERLGLTHTQAILFASHLARETGWGRYVRGYNYGNIKVGTWPGESFWLTDARGFRDRYRSYPSVDEGLRDALGLIRDSSRYRRAWKLLRAGDTRWYGQLGLDGYYEASPENGRHGVHTIATIGDVQREYDAIVALMRRHAE